MRWTQRNYRVTVSNFFWEGFECDFLAFDFTKYYAIEYELKISRSDFLRDKKKCTLKYKYNDNGFGRFKDETKHDILLSGKTVNKFYYIIPKGLVKAEEIPVFAGCLEYEVGRLGYRNFRLIKHAKLLRKERQDNKILESLIYKLDNRCNNLISKYKAHR
jgi:hypothetical protein